MKHSDNQNCTYSIVVRLLFSTGGQGSQSCSHKFWKELSACDSTEDHEDIAPFCLVDYSLVLSAPAYFLLASRVEIVLRCVECRFLFVPKFIGNKLTLSHNGPVSLDAVNVAVARVPVLDPAKSCANMLLPRRHRVNRCAVLV